MTGSRSGVISDHSAHVRSIVKMTQITPPKPGAVINETMIKSDRKQGLGSGEGVMCEGEGFMGKNGILIGKNGILMAGEGD